MEIAVATKRDQRFYKRVLRRMQLRAQAARSPDPDAKLIEDIRHTREVLNPELFPTERELEGLCYGEYAYLTPSERDEVFAKEFNKAVKAGWAVHHIRGSGVAVELKHDWIHVPLDLEVPEVRSAIRNARQHYDALGLQYGPAIAYIVNAHVTYNGGHGLPRPNQLYSYIALDTLKQDDKYIRERFVPFASGTADPRFLACNYVGHWGQDKALDAIEAYVRSEYHWLDALKRYWVEGLISEGETRRRFGDTFADRAIAAFGPARFHKNGGAEAPPRVDQRACLGVSFDPDSEMCADCPLQHRCKGITERVRLAQFAAHGVEDPRAEFQRQDTAARQRLSRARKQPEFKARAEAMEKHLADLMGFRIVNGKWVRRPRKPSKN
jgi:hypothetical protein